MIGSDRLFSVGADIRELGQSGAVREPNLPAVIQSLETCPKLVLAAIAGNCLGGGFELAMGAHFRIASRDARLALPEVKMGLLPGAGGTQRLPRAIGLENALDFILKGEPVAAKAFLDTPLIDRIVDNSLSAEAIEFAKRLVAEGAPLRKLSALEITGTNHHSVLDAARKRVSAPAVQLPRTCHDRRLPGSRGDKIVRRRSPHRAGLFSGIEGDLNPSCATLRIRGRAAMFKNSRRARRHADTGHRSRGSRRCGKPWGAASR